jgi:precorrin-6A/cobalt-precorrin-6A reductase
MKILVFGGTTEGRVLAQRLTASGHEVTVSVATELGAEMMGDFPDILIGRLEALAMERLLRNYAFCIDATHPYAVEVTKNIQAACEATGTPLRRLLRQESATEPGWVTVASTDQAAAFLAGTTGNILLTTGTKELPAFVQLDPMRLYPRVLPTHAALDTCEALGIPHKNILALQGPFTREMNEAMLTQYAIKWLVTKDGGKAGGFTDKADAARAHGVPLVLIRRPREDGQTMEEILQELGEEKAKCK